MQIHPQIAPFYEGFWSATQDEVPYAGLNVPYLRERMRRDLAALTGAAVTWDLILDINARDLGMPHAFLAEPLPEYAFAIGLLAGAWLMRKHPDADRRRVLAASQAIGEIACQESAYGPPDDTGTYRKVFAIAEQFQHGRQTEAGTESILDEILRKCL